MLSDARQPGQCIISNIRRSFQVEDTRREKRIIGKSCITASSYYHPWRLLLLLLLNILPLLLLTTATNTSTSAITTMTTTSTTITQPFLTAKQPALNLTQQGQVFEHKANLICAITGIFPKEKMTKPLFVVQQGWAVIMRMESNFT